MPRPSARQGDQTIRNKLLEELMTSLVESRKMMKNQTVDDLTRRHWTQIHTNTCQVLNTVLRDRQLEGWEKRLQELEAHGYLPRTSPNSPKNPLEATRQDSTSTLNHNGNV